MWKLRGCAVEIPRNRDEYGEAFASAAAGRGGRAFIKASTGTR
ncbi:hypothetical protein L810_5824 [Burkholderia sp. AU4i]|nr:hypothetical protein L810_5824 [Burkholderia sp. AU4i]MDW9249867.1 hypothetical protein [Burkholderia cepacia]